MRTAQQYYEAARQGDLSGLVRSCSYESRSSRSILYSEQDTERYIDITERNTDYAPYSLEVRIFPDFTYYENYCIGSNTGARIQQYYKES